MVPKGTPFEVQIRTWDMHRVAEFGIAAIGLIKKQVLWEDRKANVQVSEDKLSWLRETLEWQKDMQDPQEFFEYIKNRTF